MHGGVSIRRHDVARTPIYPMRLLFCGIRPDSGRENVPLLRDASSVQVAADFSVKCVDIYGFVDF